MHARSLALTLLVLAGCNTDLGDRTVPAESDIRRIEEQLSRHPCIGDVGEWERNYRYSRKIGLFSPYSLSPDLDVIEFHLRRAGEVSIAPGLHVFEPRGDWPDSEPIRSIDGRFKLSSGTLSLAPCEDLSGR